MVSFLSCTVFAIRDDLDKLFWVQDPGPVNTYFNKFKVASPKQVNGLHSNLVHSLIFGIGVYQESSYETIQFAIDHST